MRQELTGIYPAYFQHFDPPADAAQPRGASKLCKEYLLYLNTHSQKFRDELTGPGKRSLIRKLHEIEAKAEDELRWIKKIVSGYEFHRESADRQNAASVDQYTNMTAGDLLIWVDWKANFTLPLGTVSTNDQYWAQARMEVSCLGIVIYRGNADAAPSKVGMLYLTDIIDHTCLAACMQLEHLKRQLGDFSIYKRVSFWFDTGPHYRTADMLAFIGSEWCQKENRADLVCTINYFAEKHGKGQVDSLFGCANRWVQTACRREDVCLKTVDDLVAALRTCAGHDMQQNPPEDGGMKYLVHKWQSPKKPEKSWKADTELQIKKTYCVQVKLAGTSRVPFLLWKNLGFSDLDPAGAETFSLAVKSEKIAKESREWRRGFYTSARWMRSFPKKGDRDSMLLREDAFKVFGAPPDVDQASRFEKKVARYHEKLATWKRSRERKQRHFRARFRAASSSSSSSDDSSADS